MQIASETALLVVAADATVFAAGVGAGTFTTSASPATASDDLFAVREAAPVSEPKPPEVVFAEPDVASWLGGPTPNGLLIGTHCSIIADRGS